jgi:CDP-4-dehydro-6-deoxyglucose reductase
MFAITLKSGASFEAERGESVLAAAARAGVTLPYSCKIGRCSTCRCRPVAGRTSILHPELGLTAAEQAAGWILSCVRSAESDLVLESEELAGVVLPAPRTLACKIGRLEKLAPDVLQVFLRLPPDAGFNFLPGQYVNIIGPGATRRSYSLANGDGKVLELHIRAVPGGKMSAYWFEQARAGDLLRFNGPLGTFFLRDPAGADLVFLATGTGIAPVKSILESLPGLPPSQAPRSVTVLWGGRGRRDLYLDLGTMESRPRVIPVLSRPEPDWTGSRGHVQDVLLGMQPDLRGAAVYACGSDAMIHGAKEALTGAGLPPGRFHSDAFVCSAGPIAN